MTTPSPDPSDQPTPAESVPAGSAPEATPQSDSSPEAAPTSGSAPTAGAPTEDSPTREVSTSATADAATSATDDAAASAKAEKKAAKKAAKAKRPAGFARSMVDFRFRNYVALRSAWFVYTLAIIVALIQWAMAIMFGFLLGKVTGLALPWVGESSFNAGYLWAAIGLGWIPSLLYLVFARLALELVVSSVRTSENTAKLVEAAGGERA